VDKAVVFNVIVPQDVRIISPSTTSLPAGCFAEKIVDICGTSQGIVDDDDVASDDDDVDDMM
jgi:hypothetical protein